MQRLETENELLRCHRVCKGTCRLKRAEAHNRARSAQGNMRTQCFGKQRAAAESMVNKR